MQLSKFIEQMNNINSANKSKIVLDSYQDGIFSYLDMSDGQNIQLINTWNHFMGT